jgi:carbamoyl-phosphate synthase large subunit
VRSLPVSPNSLVDRFLEDAIEVDVDAVSDGETVLIGGVMQHVEEAGIHSGDSACVLPPLSLGPEQEAEMRRQTTAIARGLGVRGLVNVQFALHEGTVYVIEANPRASRTVPFVEKAIGIDLVGLACRVALGERLSEIGATVPTMIGVAVKEAVLPFARFPGADPVLGPEMRSTGEVMALAPDFPTAYAKASRAAGMPLPSLPNGVPRLAFLSVCDRDKSAVTLLAQRLADLGFSLCATPGTARAIAQLGIPVTRVAKIGDESGEETVGDLIRDRRVDLIVNTPVGRGARRDGYEIRRAAISARIPCITTIAGASAAVYAIGRATPVEPRALQDLHAALIAG